MKARKLKGGRIKLTFEDSDDEVKAHVFGKNDVDDMTLTDITLSAEAVRLVVETNDEC